VDRKARCIDRELAEGSKSGRIKSRGNKAEGFLQRVLRPELVRPSVRQEGVHVGGGRPWPPPGSSVA
jgi:hypothetical protein